MRTGLPAALLREKPSAIRDSQSTRRPFPAATTHARAARARITSTARGRRKRCTELRYPGVLCSLLSLLKRLGKLAVQVDELLHGYDLPAPAQEQEGWTTAVFTAVSIF